MVTRDGMPVRIICTDKKSLNFPVVALVTSKIEDGEITYTYTTEGRNLLEKESRKDLFFAPEKHEGWITVYHDLKHNEIYCGRIYASEEEATCADYAYAVATVKIEWEE